MAAWVSVYCKQRLSGVTAEQVQRALSDADLWTLAEDYDVSDDLVDAALPLLRVERVAPDHLRVHYRPADQRQVEVWRWTDPARVAEELEELDLGDRPRLEQALAATVEVVGIELGWGQTTDLGVVLAYEVARLFAAVGDGLVKGDDDAWSVIEGGAFRHL